MGLLTRRRVFLSYSREHADLVKPLAALLRLGGDNVFVDAESIRPGTRWVKEIDTSVRRSDIFVVLWCCHAGASDWVAHEVETAVTDPRRRIVPVKLCPNWIPAPLSDFQWIPYAQPHVCTPACVPGARSSPDADHPAPWNLDRTVRRASRRVWLGVVGFSGLVVTGVFAATIWFAVSGSLPIDQGPTTSAPSDGASWLVLVVLCCTFLGMLLNFARIRRLRRIRARLRSPEVADLARTVLSRISGT